MSSRLGLLGAAGAVRKSVPAPRFPLPAAPLTPPPKSPGPLTTGKFSFRKGKSKGTENEGWKSSVGATATAARVPVGRRLDTHAAVCRLRGTSV